MARTLTQVNTAADTFGGFVTKVNAAINAISTDVMTANAAANGAVTTGNAYLNGIFAATTIAATVIRGGNVQASALLTLNSNLFINTSTLSIGNSTVNTFANSSYLDVISADITTGNIVTLNTGVATINTLSILTSESIANLTVINASGITVSNTLSTAKMAPLTITVGNSTVNATVNSSTVQFANSSGTFTVDGSTGVSATEYNSRFKFANVTLTGTSTQTVDSFNKVDYRVVEYMFSVFDNTANNRQSSKLAVLHDDSSSVAYTTEYAVMATNNLLGTFSAIANSTQVIVQFTPSSTNCKVGFARIGVNAQ